MATTRKDKESPFKIWQAVGNLAGGIFTGIAAGKAAKKAEAAMEGPDGTKAQLKRAREAMYNLDISNPFEGMQNQFAGMENKMEDLTVNQKEAEFASQQFAQSQSNIMSGLRGAAGGSGIAALAQSLAQQGQIAAQKSAAGIGQQEAANQAKKAAAAADIQTRERQGAADVANKIAAGEQAAQQMDLNKTQQIFQNAAQEQQAAQAAADEAAAQASATQAAAERQAQISILQGEITGWKSEINSIKSQLNNAIDRVNFNKKNKSEWKGRVNSWLPQQWLGKKGINAYKRISKKYGDLDGSLNNWFNLNKKIKSNETKIANL